MSNITEFSPYKKGVIFLSLTNILLGSLLISSYVINSQLSLDNESKSINITQLESNNTNLIQQKTELVNQNQVLSENITAVERLYKIEQALHIGNGLASYYDLLRTNMGPTGSAWATGTSEQMSASANFSALLALHDLGRIYWPSYETSYNNTFHERSCQTAYRKICEIRDLLEISTGASNVEKISIILDFVHQFITYQHEINDVFHSSLESLAYKSGDCDDFSTLTATLFELVGIESAVGLFKNTSLGGHAMVLVQLNDLEGKQYRYYPNLTTLHCDSGKWIVIEPQSTLKSQNLTWISYWNLIAAGELDTEHYT